MAIATLGTLEAFHTIVTNAIAAGITYPPGPALIVAFTTTLTRNPHKRKCFKLIFVLCCKDRKFLSNHQGFDGKIEKKDGIGDS